MSMECCCRGSPWWRMFNQHGLCCRANCLLRVVRPDAVQSFAVGHTNALWACLRNILGSSVDLNPTLRDVGTLPLSLGGMGLRNTERTSPPAYWASWADCLSMLRARHPDVAALCVDQMQNPRGPPSLEGAQTAAGHLSGVEGFQVTSWEDLAMVCAPQNLSRTILNQGGAEEGGSMKVPLGLNDSTGGPSWRGSQTVSGRCYVRKAAFWLGCRCPPRLPTS